MLGIGLIKYLQNLQIYHFRYQNWTGHSGRCFGLGRVYENLVYAQVKDILIILKVRNDLDILEFIVAADMLVKGYKTGSMLNWREHSGYVGPRTVLKYMLERPDQVGSI